MRTGLTVAGSPIRRPRTAGPQDAGTSRPGHTDWRRPPCFSRTRSPSTSASGITRIFEGGVRLPAHAIATACPGGARAAARTGTAIAATRPRAPGVAAGPRAAAIAGTEIGTRCVAGATGAEDRGRGENSQAAEDTGQGLWPNVGPPVWLFAPCHRVVTTGAPFRRKSALTALMRCRFLRACGTVGSLYVWRQSSRRRRRPSIREACGCRPKSRHTDITLGSGIVHANLSSALRLPGAFGSVTPAVAILRRLWLAALASVVVTWMGRGEAKLVAGIELHWVAPGSSSGADSGSGSGSSSGGASDGGMPAGNPKGSWR